MLGLKKILAIVELDDDTHPALDKAVQLAQYGNAELELLCTEYTPYFADGHYFDPIQARQLREQHLDEQFQQLEAIAKPLRDDGVSVTVSTAWGNPPYEQINNHIAKSKPSLVVKGTRHHSKVARFFLANEDWELVRHCSIPLLLVKGQPWQEPPVFIGAVDPEHAHEKPASLDFKLIQSTLELAAICNGAAHLYHAHWVPPLAGSYPRLMGSVQSKDKFLKLGQEHGIGAEFCHWSEKAIEISLPDLAEKLQASIVVMGAISRSRVDRVLIGSTAERLLDNLVCDVLIIKPD